MRGGRSQANGVPYASQAQAEDSMVNNGNNTTRDIELRNPIHVKVLYRGILPTKSSRIQRLRPAYQNETSNCETNRVYNRRNKE